VSVDINVVSSQQQKTPATLNYSNYKATAKTRTWANAQRDGRPTEYRWRPLFNATKFE